MFGKKVLVVDDSSDIVYKLEQGGGASLIRETPGTPPAQPGPGQPATPPAGASPAPQGGENGKPPAASPQSPAQVFHELKINGKVEKLTTEQLIARGQQIGNITQREQEIAAQRKEMSSKLTRLDELLREAEKGNQPPEEVDEIQQLRSDIKELKTREESRESHKALEKALEPVRKKFPNMDDKMLDKALQHFADNVKSRKGPKGEPIENPDGLYDNDAAGVAKAIEDFHAERDGMVKGGLEKLLANPEAPELKAYNEKLIADYVAGKYKLANAGGDLGGQGGAGNGAATKPGEDISAVAARLRG